VAFSVQPSGVPEDAPPGPPAEVAISLALAKARAVAGRMAPEGDRPAIVLGADTIVVLDGALLGKPSGAEDAARMLRALRGRAHEVVTGVALVRAGGEPREATDAVSTRVTMAPYSDRQIEAYLATGEPFDKAGAYAVQGLGGRLVESVDGCLTNVVGLPLTTTRRLLEAWGAL